MAIKFVVLVIEFVTLANEFISLAIKFVTLALEFVALAQEFVACVTVDSCTKFVVNLRNIQGVISVYSHKKDQTSVTATG